MDDPVSLLYAHVVATAADLPIARQIDLFRALRECVHLEDLRDHVDAHIARLRAVRDSHHQLTLRFTPRQ